MPGTGNHAGAARDSPISATASLARSRRLGGLFSWAHAVCQRCHLCTVSGKTAFPISEGRIPKHPPTHQRHAFRLFGTVSELAYQQERAESFSERPVHG